MPLPAVRIRDACNLCSLTGRCSTKVVRWPSKPTMRVRFPPPALCYMSRPRKGPLQPRNDFGISVSASKHKRRKLKYLKSGSFGGAPWEEKYKATRKSASRTVRYGGRIRSSFVDSRVVDHNEGKRKVASNRCGNDCGRRSSIGDYLCDNCRQESGS